MPYRLTMVSRLQIGERFRRLWTATAASNLGDGVILTTLPVLAVSAGASVGQVALVTIAATAAWPLFGLHAGWLVDRLPRRALFLGSDVARFLALGYVAVAAALGELAPGAIVVAALVYGITETLIDTGLQSSVPLLVAAHARVTANARIEATANAMNQLAGPPLAGVLIALSAWVSIATGSALYALAGLAVTAIGPLPHGHLRGTEQAPVDRRLRAGIGFLMRHRVLLPLTGLTALMNIVWGGWTAIFVAWALRGPLALGSIEYGLLLAAVALGGLCASVFAGTLRRRIGTAWTLAVNTVTTFGLTLPAALGANVWLTGTGLLLAGAGSSLWVITAATIRQQLTPSWLLGRVYSTSRVISWGAVPIGAALAGLLASSWGLRGAFGILSAVACTALVAFAILRGRFTSVDGPDPIRIPDQSAAEKSAANEGDVSCRTS